MGRGGPQRGLLDLLLLLLKGRRRVGREENWVYIVRWDINSLYYPIQLFFGGEKFLLMQRSKMRSFMSNVCLPKSTSPYSKFPKSLSTKPVTLKLNAPNFIANFNIFRIVKKIGNCLETKSFEASSNISRRWPFLTMISWTRGLWKLRTRV
jgi:hypothetical protein